MPLLPIPDLMRRARAQGCAVGYFESWNLESLQGVIDAAEETRSPVIIGFNGEFLTRPERRASERIAWYGALGRAAAESASVPCGFIFNECPLDAPVREAVDAGFNLVMPVPAHAEAHDAYAARVRAIVAFAHGRGVAVEAELGELPFGPAGQVGGSATDPQAAAAFVAATGIDLLAVSVGNVHILLDGQQALDLSALEAIHRAADVALVLH
ncbi:MAG: class II fructose-bisphosphate aldolase, partial [Chloroflexota bacterium]|nr:class II fructose-bisphosphate aldolase [Chloroflexota bacterium]